MFGELPVELYFDPAQSIRPRQRGVFRWTLVNLSSSAVITDLTLELESTAPGLEADRLTIAPRHIGQGGVVSCTQDLYIDAEGTAGFGINIRVKGKLDGKRHFDLISVNQHIFKFTAKGDGGVLSLDMGDQGVYMPEAVRHDQVHLRGKGGIAHLDGLNPETNYTIEGFDGAVVRAGAGDARPAGNLRTDDQVRFEALRRVALMHRPEGIYPVDFDAYAAAWRHRRDLLALEFVDAGGSALGAASAGDDFIVRARTKRFGNLILLGQGSSGRFTQWLPTILGPANAVGAGTHRMPGDLLPLPCATLGPAMTRIRFGDDGVERVLGFLLQGDLPDCITVSDPRHPISDDLMETILTELCRRTDASLALARITVYPQHFAL